MSRCVIALGSNKEPRKAFLLKASQYLGKHPHITLQRFAPLYHSLPWGGVATQPFLNSAILISTTLSPWKLLSYCQWIEEIVGRTPSPRWGDREIDLDLLVYDQLVLHTVELTLPHQGLIHRSFMLEPLRNLLPGYVHPELRMAITDLPDPPDKLKIIDRAWLLPVFEHLNLPQNGPHEG